ncbi:MAG: HIRAN domain-containing protein [Clostridia bacterium]|nr:HIRAN domain-containing protein [Clostridia bacterium]
MELKDTVFITLTGLSNYYGLRPFRRGLRFGLCKEPQNPYDEEAIYAELPYIGKIGYVANSTHTVYQGTASAGRIYDLFTDVAVGEVMFVTRSSVIARLVPPDEVGEDAEEKAALYRRRGERDGGASDRSDWENVLPDFKLRPYDV